MPNAIIIAGPNGAGKTTFADEYLSAERRQFEFVNADEIARGLQAQGLRPPSDVLAARAMLRRMDELVEANADFAIETTLATLTYAQKVPLWRQRGYIVSLAYLRLGAVEDSIARVLKRVQAGGHGIPEQRSVGDLTRAFCISKPSTNRSSTNGICGRVVRVPSLSWTTRVV